MSIQNYMYKREDHMVKWFVFIDKDTSMYYIVRLKSPKSIS